MKDNVFFDSNIILYALGDDDSPDIISYTQDEDDSSGLIEYSYGDDSANKAERARELLHAGGVISVQVLNEVANVACRKYKLPWSAINEGLEDVKALCAVVPLTMEVHECGIYVAERYKLSVYDAMIVAAALLSDCAVVYSEDMHNGLVVEDQLRIINPFA